MRLLELNNEFLHNKNIFAHTNNLVLSTNNVEKTLTRLLFANYDKGDSGFQEIIAANYLSYSKISDGILISTGITRNNYSEPLTYYKFNIETKELKKHGRGLLLSSAMDYRVFSDEHKTYVYRKNDSIIFNRSLLNETGGAAFEGFLKDNVVRLYYYIGDKIICYSLNLLDNSISKIETDLGITIVIEQSKIVGNILYITTYNDNVFKYDIEANKFYEQPAISLPGTDNLRKTDVFENIFIIQETLEYGSLLKVIDLITGEDLIEHEVLCMNFPHEDLPYIVICNKDKKIIFIDAHDLSNVVIKTIIKADIRDIFYAEQDFIITQIGDENYYMITY